MTPDDLRALADALEPMARAPRFEDFDVPAFCAWVRACADAKPVAWIGPSRPKIDGADHRVLRQDYDASHGYGWSRDTAKANGFLPLYTHPAPAPSQAEPSAALIRAYNSGYMQGHHDTVESCFIDIHPLDMDTYHADLVAELGLSAAPQAEPKREPRPCTCHPDETQIEARDALLDFISENGTASEGVQYYLDRYVRAALAAKEQK